MQAEIHPKYAAVAVKCSCGSTFEIKSAMDKNTLHIEVCDKCHPFYTGNQKIVDTAGRVDSFNKKFNFGGKEN